MVCSVEYFKGQTAKHLRSKGYIRLVTTIPKNEFIISENPLKVEYLVIVDTKGGFCNSIKSFHSLLTSYDEINITTDGIEYSSMKFGFGVDTNMIGKSEQRYFHIKLELQSIDSIEVFSNLARLIKKILFKVGVSAPQVIWDDISRYYASLAYPYIYSVENLMRKLITKFMFTRLGVHWEKGTVPDEVKQSVRLERKKDSNLLFEIDFIQLSNFLFTTYNNVPVSQLLSKIDEIEVVSELHLGDLKEFVPRSNWERHFSKIVDCSSEYLHKKWEQLYELRCKIAHNKDFRKNDLERTAILVEDVTSKLNDAILNLEHIQISEEEVDVVAENMVGNLSSAYGEFIQNWKELVSFLSELVSITGGGEAYQLRYYKYDQNVNILLKILNVSQVLDDETCKRINGLRVFRNTLVHRTDIVYTEEQVNLAAKQVKEEISEIISYLSDSILMELASDTIADKY